MTAAFLAKNLFGDMHERHSKKMIGEKPEQFLRILTKLKNEVRALEMIFIIKYSV